MSAKPGPANLEVRLACDRLEAETEIHHREDPELRKVRIEEPARQSLEFIVNTKVRHRRRVCKRNWRSVLYRLKCFARQAPTVLYCDPQFNVEKLGELSKAYPTYCPVSMKLSDDTIILLCVVAATHYWERFIALMNPAAKNAPSFDIRNVRVMSQCPRIEPCIYSGEEALTMQLVETCVRNWLRVNCTVLASVPIEWPDPEHYGEMCWLRVARQKGFTSVQEMIEAEQEEFGTETL